MYICAYVYVYTSYNKTYCIMRMPRILLMWNIEDTYGSNSKQYDRETCEKNLSDCMEHFGYLIKCKNISVCTYVHMYMYIKVITKQLYNENATHIPNVEH